MHTLSMKLGDALLMNGPLFVRFGGGKSTYLVLTFSPHGVRKVLPCVEGPEVMEMACRQPPLPTPHDMQVHSILGEDWDVRVLPRQRRSLELICHASAAEPHAGPELCAGCLVGHAAAKTFPAAATA